MSKITQARLRHLFAYQDGQLIRKHSRGANGGARWKSGTAIGSRGQGGYVIASVDYEIHKLHRLIWLWHNGAWPSGHIDHIDGDPSNNRIENLREATDAQNMQNIRRPRSTNRLGVLGVHVNRGRYRVRITKDRQSIHIGYFDNPEEAHAAYVKAKRVYHPFSTIGEKVK